MTTPSRTAAALFGVGLLGAGLLGAGLLTAGPSAAQNPAAPADPSAGSSAPAAPPAPSPAPAARPDCPPGVNSERAPTLGGGTTGSGETLSSQLSESKGVICPPASHDPGIVEAPPAGGALKVIPPPGSPGGDTTVTPK